MTFLLLACALSRHPHQPAALPPTAEQAWAEILARPGVIEHEAVLSARWEAKAQGLVNLDHPQARAAGLEKGKAPIVLPVHLLRHPTRGVFVVDTGVPRDLRESARGLARLFLQSVEPAEPLGETLARHPGPVGGVLLTHAHPDHVLGLPDVPPDTPIYTGPGELDARRMGYGLMRRSYNALLDDRTVYTWDFSQAPQIGGIRALDVLGDGSLWALACPGHTPGSTAYLALTTAGPVLAVGDTSHTLWGWENGVEPGSFTSDTAANAASLAKLRALAAAHPEIRVFVGHELDGAGTGVDEEKP